MALLAKFAPGDFNAAKHPRDTGGRFSMIGGTVAGGKPAPIVAHSTAKRSLTRGEAWQRVGTRIAAIPRGYTGSEEREKPVDGYSELTIHQQKPKAVPPAADDDLRQGLHRIARDQRMPTVARAQEQNLIPEGSTRQAVNRAYNHAALLALHDYGTIDYDFHMSDVLKDEMMPLKGFIQYARRRLKSEMLGTHKGGWRPYRAEFGQPFKDQRKDRLTGAVRLRTRPNQELVKSDGDFVNSDAPFDNVVESGRAVVVPGLSGILAKADALLGSIHRYDTGRVGGLYVPRRHNGSRGAFFVPRRSTGTRGTFFVSRRDTGTMGDFKVRHHHNLDFGLAKMGMDPNPAALGVPATAQPGVSRWDRWRSSLATGEHMGEHDAAPLSFNQKLERIRAARDFRMKRMSGAPLTRPGQTGSISGLGVSGRQYVSPTPSSIVPQAKPGAAVRPAGMSRMGKRAPHHPLLHELVPASLHALILPKPKGKATAAPKEVKGALAEAAAILAHASGPTVDPGARHERSHIVADPSRPLHHALRG